VDFKESYDVEIVEVMPCDVELVDPISIKSPLELILRSIILGHLAPIFISFFRRSLNFHLT